jgi:hypothetical protein
LMRNCTLSQKAVAFEFAQEPNQFHFTLHSRCTMFLCELKCFFLSLQSTFSGTTTKALNVIENETRCECFHHWEFENSNESRVMTILMNFYEDLEVLLNLFKWNEHFKCAEKFFLLKF